MKLDQRIILYRESLLNGCKNFNAIGLYSEADWLTSVQFDLFTINGQAFIHAEVGMMLPKLKLYLN